jgi:hypothetical protein
LPRDAPRTLDAGVGHPPQAPQRPPPGTINITPYNKVFEEKIASMKEKQYDGSKRVNLQN